jgi:hypothetical protein
MHPTRRRFLIRASAGSAVLFAGLHGARLFSAAQAASVTLTARGPQPVPILLTVNGGRVAATAQHGHDRRQHHAAHALRVLPRRLAGL